MIEERSAGIVIFRKKGDTIFFLLLNYPAGHWDFVKGKIESGESDINTAIRETKEETGIIDLEFVDGFNEKIEYNFQFEGKLIHKEVVFFLAKTITEDIKISHEHTDYMWLDFEKALMKTTFQNAKNILSKANGLIIGKIL